MNQSEINSSILFLRIFTITRHKQSNTTYILHHTIKNNRFISTLKCSDTLVAFKKSFIQPLHNLHVKLHLWKRSSLRIQSTLQDFFRIRIFIKCGKVKEYFIIILAAFYAIFGNHNIIVFQHIFVEVSVKKFSVKCGYLRFLQPRYF